MSHITYEEFKKMDIRIGTIRKVEPVEGTDKLLACQVDVGDTDEDGNNTTRQIVSGIRESYPEYKELEGKQVLYIVNLEPREIRGVTSYGMLLAVTDDEGTPIFLTPESPVEPGSSIS